MNKKVTRPMALFVLVLMVSGVGTVDYLAGYELRLGALYAVTVGFATWYLGLPAGVVCSLITVGIAHWAELAGGKVYNQWWVPYANSASRFSIYLFVALSFGYFRRTIDRAASQLRAFQGRLPVCGCCNRVDGGDGFWMDFPTYVRKNSAVAPVFKTCPVCEREDAKSSNKAG
jgi:hypothetical protein